MTAKQQAIQDIKDDLSRQGKCFIAFHKELNPIMKRLVSKQIERQIGASYSFNTPNKSKSQLMARCFFCNGQVKLDNYSKYYENK